MLEENNKPKSIQFKSERRWEEQGTKRGEEIG